MDLALIEALSRQAGSAPSGGLGGLATLPVMRGARALLEPGTLPLGGPSGFTPEQDGQLAAMNSLSSDLQAMVARMRAGKPADPMMSTMEARRQAYENAGSGAPLPSAQPDPIADIPLGNRPSWSRRWQGMGADSLNRDPLGATRMTQPMMGPIPAGSPAADVDAQRAQALAELQQMQAAAPGIIEGLGSSRAMAVQDVLSRLRNPGLAPDERRNLGFAGLNLDLDPSGRMGPVKDYPSQPSTRKYTDQRQADLAQREAGVKANAADRRDARKIRMGEGPAMYANRAMGMQQQALDMINGGGGAPAAAGDSPAAAGPAGGFLDPIAGAMAGIPPALIAERNDNTRFQMANQLQQKQFEAGQQDDLRRVTANTGGSARDLVGIGSSPDQMAEWDAKQAERVMALNPQATRQELEAQLVAQGLDPMSAGMQAFLLRSKYPHLFPPEGQLNPIAAGLKAIGGQAMAAMPGARQATIDWLGPLGTWMY